MTPTRVILLSTGPAIVLAAESPKGSATPGGASGALTGVPARRALSCPSPSGPAGERSTGLPGEDEPVVSACAGEP